MKRQILFLATIVSVIINFGCNSTKINNDTVKKIYLIQKLPIVELDGKMQEVSDSICIYYYKNYSLYQLPYEYNESKVKVIDGKEDEDGKLIDSITKSEQRYNLLFCQNDKNYGYESISETEAKWENFIKSPEDLKKWKKVNADSILDIRTPRKMNFALMRNLATLTSTKVDPHTNTTIQKFATKVVMSENDVDTSYLYFSKSLNTIPFTYSKYWDSVNAMKLFKIRLLFKERFSEEYKIMVPQIEWFFEMNAIPVPDQKRMVSFFESFLTDNIK